jgi:hypothetical protein
LSESDQRTRARLVRALWTLGAHDKAIAAAETAMANSDRLSPTMDPRADASSEPTGMRNNLGHKTARRAMTTSRMPVAEQSLLYEVESAAKGGHLAKASALADKISIPIFKARALGAVAAHHPGMDGALEAWMSALIFACRAGRGEVERLLPVGTLIFHKAGRGAEAAALDLRVWDVDAAWQLELFVDEYASLRANMRRGKARTRLMTSLMLAPIELAKRRPWTEAEVRRAWERGEAGSRLFALGLMIGLPQLALADVLEEGIRRSRSAFEQNRALYAAANSDLGGDDAARVVQAVRDELEGRPRPDGSKAFLPEGQDRLRLAERVLQRLSPDGKFAA